MCIGHEEFFYIILVQLLHTFDSLASTVLGFECIVRHSLDISKLCHRDDNIFSWDQVFHGDIKLIESDGCSSLISVFITDHKDLFFDHAK